MFDGDDAALSSVQVGQRVCRERGVCHRGAGCREHRRPAWAHSENLEWPNSFEGKRGLEHGGVGVFVGTLVDSGRGVVDPCQATHGVRG